ncbi:hypothetical protein TNCV_1771181 [Trichonephila clavipes]|nr:hypothetical protein TNCV_1771181 [Trichonephila clavipes]
MLVESLKAQSQCGVACYLCSGVPEQLTDMLGPINDSTDLSLNSSSSSSNENEVTKNEPSQDCETSVSVLQD